VAKVEIKSLCDCSDCETCGGGWANGFEVLIDGKPFGDYEPIASCYDSVSFELDLVLTDVLAELGHELVFSQGE
jgi:hypothetical protein